jgi:hypothetical protein
MWEEMIAVIVQNDSFQVNDLRSLSIEREIQRLNETYSNIQKLIEINNTMTYTCNKPFLFV